MKLKVTVNGVAYDIEVEVEEQWNAPRSARSSSDGAAPSFAPSHCLGAGRLGQCRGGATVR